METPTPAPALAPTRHCRLALARAWMAAAALTLLTSAGVRTSAAIADSDRPGRPDDPQAAAATPAPAARPAELSNETGHTTTIVKLVKADELVTKGQLVCELDDGAIREELLLAQVAVKQAERDVKTAQLAREAGELAMKEYVEGTSVLQRRPLQFAVTQAEAAHAFAVEEVARIEKSVSERKIDRGTLDRAKQRAKQTQEALERAQRRLKTYDDVDRPAQIKLIQNRLDAMIAAEKESKAAVETEKSKAAKLALQAGRCKLYAPIAGRVLYLAPPAGPDGAIADPIEPGVEVVDHQALVRIVPETDDEP